MRKRCSDPTRRDYKWYGAKGIKVCERWQSFENFCDDMLSSWFVGGTIERQDNDKDYSSENCTWVTITQQQQNRSNTPHIQKYSQVKTLRQQGLTQQTIADLLGMSQGQVSRIILKVERS